MKKKTVKKLVLAKETVRSLEDDQLKHAAGGMQKIHLSDTECWSNAENFCG